MKVAVVNMPTVLAEINVNMQQAEKYVKEASLEQVKIIVFPEFFTTGFAVNDQLITAISHSFDIRDRLLEMSKKYHIVIAGSYLYPDVVNKEIYNQYSLFFPTGEIYSHSKDIPTGLENFCYTDGDNVSAFETPLGKIGIVMCWEQLRYQTIKRMAGKVDFVVGGSCWWNFAKEDGKELQEQLSGYNKMLAEHAPYQFAKLLGVPYIHASHTALFTGKSLNGQNECKRKIEGPTVIVNSKGEQIVKKEQPGYVIYDLETGSSDSTKAIQVPDDRFWIPELPEPMKKGFELLNKQWRKVYIEKTRPFIFK